MRPSASQLPIPLPCRLKFRMLTMASLASPPLPFPPSPLVHFPSWLLHACCAHHRKSSSSSWGACTAFFWRLWASCLGENFIFPDMAQRSSSSRVSPEYFVVRSIFGTTIILARTSKTLFLAACFFDFLASCFGLPVWLYSIAWCLSSLLR